MGKAADDILDDIRDRFGDAVLPIYEHIERKSRSAPGGEEAHQKARETDPEYRKADDDFQQAKKDRDERRRKREEESQKADDAEKRRRGNNTSHIGVRA